MSGESHPHSACWMLWPTRLDNWHSNAVFAEKAWIEVIQAISRFEHVYVGTNKNNIDSPLTVLCRENKNVSLFEIDYDDCWMRDVGPTFTLIISNENSNNNQDGVIISCSNNIEGNYLNLGATDWKFNAWGEKYPSFINDDRVAKLVCNRIGIPNHNIRRADFILEGGSIHVDGEGTILTTEECLLHPNRNPHLNKIAIQTLLLDYLGAEKVIWLTRGLVADDDTNGHIDNMCCFSKPGEVLLAWCDDPTDDQYLRCREAFNTLTNETDAKGRSIHVVKLPIPPPMYYTKEECESLEISQSSDNSMTVRSPGQRLAASYINFYIANGGIVYPHFGHPPADKAAAAILQSVFVNYELISIQNARDILVGGGNIHCITQQQPRPS